MVTKQSVQPKANDVVVVLDKRGNRENSEKIATMYGGQLLTIKEFVQTLKDQKQYLKMRGDRYWVANTKLDLYGLSRIDYDKGTVTSVSEEEYGGLPFEQRAFAWGGQGPVSIFLFQYASTVNRMFLLADNSTDLLGRVVIKKKSPKPVKSNVEQQDVIKGEITSEYLEVPSGTSNTGQGRLDKVVRLWKSGYIQKLLRTPETKE